MRVLISGVSGFIGSHLFQRLASKGVDVAGVCRPLESMSPTSAIRFKKIREIAATNFNAHLLPCLLSGELSRQFADFQPTVCVHLAGRSSVRESLQNPGLYADANNSASICVLEAARFSQCKRIIHASSVMIYGKDAPAPYHEEFIGSVPASIYGASKLGVEILMNTWRALHGMETINLRLFSVYGPELRPDCVPHLIATAIRNKTEFTIFGDGSSVRDYVEIDDVLDAIEAAIAAPWTSDFPRALNIGSGIGTPLLELVKQIEYEFNEKARIVHKPAQAGELRSISADIAAAERVLGWKPRAGLDAGLSRLIAWFKTRG